MDLTDNVYICRMMQPKASKKQRWCLISQLNSKPYEGQYGGCNCQLLSGSTMYGPTGALTSLLFLMATRRNCGISGMSVGKSEWRKNEVTNVANILNCNSRPSSSFYLKKSKQVKQGFYSKKSSTSLRSYPYSSFAIQFSTIGRWPIRFCNLLLQRVDIFQSRLLQTPFRFS